MKVMLGYATLTQPCISLDMLFSYQCVRLWEEAAPNLRR